MTGRLLTRRRFAAGLAGGAALGAGMAAVSRPARALTFAGGPRRLRIDAATDLDAMVPVLEAFQQANPDVTIDYSDLGTRDLYEGFLTSVANGQPVADVMMSSSMDLQIKLVNDGYALHHSSAATEGLPDWAMWRNEAFGFTFEPAVFAYNRKFFGKVDPPQSRWELIDQLHEHPEIYEGRIATYDIEDSGVGYLMATQDSRQTPAFWDLMLAMAEREPQRLGTTSRMMDGLAEGRYALAYNALGSYAQRWAERNPDIGIALPSDYMLVLSRIAFLPKAAPHPELGARFLDFLLSLAGQQVLANQSSLGAVRPEAASAHDLVAAAQGPLRPIRLGPGLLVHLDDVKRRIFLRQWRTTLGLRS